MYFSQVRVDPNDPDVVIDGGVGLHFSSDGGKTVHTDIAASTHDDVHAIWIDPSNSNHVIIGNDGGLAVSWDQAKTWTFLPNLPVGLFYHVSVDMATPYNICGGMQDNYSWCGPSAGARRSRHRRLPLVHGAGRRRLRRACRIRPTSGLPTANRRTATWCASIASPANRCRFVRRRPAGEPALRWNWDTPLVMSPHNPSIIYAAGNKLFRSSNRGLTWESLGHAI